jgi:hypothetical protein
LQLKGSEWETKKSREKDTEGRLKVISVDDN